MKLFNLISYYMPSNMSIFKKTYDSYTILHTDHPYMVMNNDQYAFLKHILMIMKRLLFIMTHYMYLLHLY